MTQLRSFGLRLLLAIGLSFTLWVYVTFNENPDSTTTFQEIPIRVQGKDPQLVLVDERGAPLPEDALPVRINDLAIQTDANTLSRLSRSDIDAFVDLSGLGPGDSNQPVRVQTQRPDLRLTFLEVEPDFVPIRLERQITTTVPLSVTVTGIVPFVYERGEPQIVGEGADGIAQITGPEGLVRQVGQVRAVAEIGGLSASFESSLPLRPVDAVGREIKGVQVVPTEVAVIVPISPRVGIKPVAVLAPSTVGAPAPGFQVAAITVTPPFVNLTGSSEALADVRSISTNPITISGANATLIRELDLLIPKGVSLVDSPSRVQVQVEIAPVTRPLAFTSPLPVQVVNLEGGVLLRSASPASVLVTLETATGGVGDIDISEGRAVVDVAGLGPGTYELVPRLVLPDGVEVAGDVPVVTVVIVAPTPQPRPTPAATSPVTGTAEVEPTSTEPPSEEPEPPGESPVATSEPESPAPLTPTPVTP